MKKLILIVCAAMAFVALADDSYLYWMVNDDVNGITLNGESYDYKSLTVKVVAYDSSTWRPNQTPDNGGKPLTLYSAAGGLASLGKEVTITGANSPFYAGILSGMTKNTWSYFVELYNDQGFVGRSSEGLTYANAEAMEYLMGSDLKPGTGPWIVSSFTTTPAPEPNSALLLLIGCAALALRRRKQIAA